MRPTEAQKAALGAEIERLREAKFGPRSRAKLGRMVGDITGKASPGQSVSDWENGKYAPQDDATMDALEQVLCPDDLGHLWSYISDATSANIGRIEKRLDEFDARLKALEAKAKKGSGS